jgi:hypothetical protein
MDTSTSRAKASFARRHSGALAAVTAVAGFAIGSSGTYHVLHRPPAPPIILRQAVETDQMASYDQAPGAGGVLVLLRNDGAVPVEVIDAAFSRTTAAPPLYIAPEVVLPGAVVNVYVGIPGACDNNVSGLTITGAEPPIVVLVSAHRLGAPVERVPVEITGQLAAIMAACHRRG